MRHDSHRKCTTLVEWKMNMTCDALAWSRVFLCECEWVSSAGCVLARCTARLLEKLETLNSFVLLWRRQHRIFSNHFRRAHVMRTKTSEKEEGEKWNWIGTEQHSNSLEVATEIRRCILSCIATESSFGKNGGKGFFVVVWARAHPHQRRSWAVITYFVTANNVIWISKYTHFTWALNYFWRFVI